MSNLVRNERIKLAANWLNAMASASYATGFIAPIIAVSLGAIAAATLSVVIQSSIRLAGGFILHLSGRWLLGGLRE